MRIEVHVAGGVAGVRMGGSEDTETLELGLAEQVESCLAPERLNEHPQTDVAGQVQADLRQFTVVSGGRRFELNEADLDDEQVEVLDALLAEIAARRRGRRGK